VWPVNQRHTDLWSRISRSLLSTSIIGIIIINTKYTFCRREIHNKDISENLKSFNDDDIDTSQALNVT